MPPRGSTTGGRPARGVWPGLQHGEGDRGAGATSPAARRTRLQNA